MAEVHPGRWSRARGAVRPEQNAGAALRLVTMPRPPTILGFALCLPLSGNGNSDRYGRYYRLRVGGDRPGAYVADGDHHPPCLTRDHSELSCPFTRAAAARVLPEPWGETTADRHMPIPGPVL